MIEFFRKYRVFIRDLTTLVAVLLAGYTVIVQQSQRDAARDQICLSFERQERSAVNQVQRQYDFLHKLPKSEHGSFLVKAIVSGLPALYEDAVSSEAPHFCLEEGMGLPNNAVPDLPKRENFDNLLVKPADGG